MNITENMVHSRAMVDAKINDGCLGEDKGDTVPGSKALLVPMKYNEEPGSITYCSGGWFPMQEIEIPSIASRRISMRPVWLNWRWWF